MPPPGAAPGSDTLRDVCCMLLLVLRPLGIDLALLFDDRFPFDTAALAVYADVVPPRLARRQFLRAAPVCRVGVGLALLDQSLRAGVPLGEVLEREGLPGEVGEHPLSVLPCVRP